MAAVGQGRTILAGFPTRVPSSHGALARLHPERRSYTTVARKPNYDAEKRRKEQDRKAQKEAKRADRQQRREDRRAEEEAAAESSESPDAPQTESAGAESSEA